MLNADQIPAELGSLLSRLEQELSDSFDAQQQQRYTQALGACPDLHQHLQTALLCSKYFFHWASSRSEEFLSLLESGDLYHSRSELPGPARPGLDEAGNRQRLAHFRQALQQRCAALGDNSAQASEEELASQLRRFRNREMARLIFRDFNRLAAMGETTADISALADACIQMCLEFLQPRLSKDFGTPTSHRGEAQQMVVIGMGKLGDYELNLSSDIDLIFCYPKSGNTEGAARSLDNQQFFIRLAQRLIKMLDTINNEGFVFRVDMRLRPYGQSGALVLSFSAMEQYYEDQGREWERYAMIKARIVAGDVDEGRRLMALLRPFTYRRYIDYSAINSLRSMKVMINSQIQRQGKEGDVKLGRGGIREIEFIVQSFQLIRGGRDVGFQQRGVLSILDYMKESHVISATAVLELQQAYIFLRNTEHAIQGYADQQTQQLPLEPLHRSQLAYCMGFKEWDTFCQCLQMHRDNVSRHFEQVVGEPEEGDGAVDELADWITLWQGQVEDDYGIDCLQQAGFEDPRESWRLLKQFRNGESLRGIQSTGRQRIDRFVPILLQALTGSATPSRTFARLMPLLESVARRTAYLMILMENEGALKQLIILCDASAWIARQIALHPVLMDELLDVNSLYSAPGIRELADELRQFMLRVPQDDLERQMEMLRYFKMSHILRVTALEVTGQLPLMKVSDYLSYLADVLLEYVTDLAWSMVEAVHGQPCNEKGEPLERCFLVVGYGKLGGLELGHGSDLDLVFLYDAPGSQSTSGERAISNSIFFTRVGQKIIHIVNTRTQMGMLYEIDMRLRPSGESGMLVTTMEAFRRYQRTDAWTWEHQALVRARVVAGAQVLAEQFTAIRREILLTPRDISRLRDEVVAMRRKMRDHLDRSGTDDEENAVFDLKQGAGGIVDIEFMVQYAVLAWANRYPELATYTDNIRILGVLAETELFSQQTVVSLIEAYKTYRVMSHRLALQEHKGAAPSEDVADIRATVIEAWNQLFGPESGAPDAE